MQKSQSFVVSLVAMVASGAIGCSSSSTSSGSDGGGSGGPVSFSTDVLPVFQQNCSTGTTCHGQMKQAVVENLYLGPSSGPIDSATAKTVYDELVGVNSLEDPSMKLVAANTPNQSYLLQKVNGNEGMFAADCAKVPLCPSPTCTTKTPCGADMPYLGESLTISDPMGIQQLTDWIAQGAKNN
jgi:hypothetical protein